MREQTSFINIYIVIPAYNEEKVLGDVIRQIRKEGYKNIIVIDDGSEDKTFSLAKAENVCVLRHIINCGEGAAIKTGIEAAKILGAKYIITFDADDQHDPKEIRFITRKLKEGFDVVLGSRMINKNKIPFSRKIAIKLGNFFTWFLFGVWVSDSQSGFRGYSEKAFSKINIKNSHYEYSSEIIREIGKYKLKYCEIPINIRYTYYSMHKKHGQSFINGIKTLARLAVLSD